MKVFEKTKKTMLSTLLIFLALIHTQMWQALQHEMLKALLYEPYAQLKMYLRFRN